MPEAIPEKYRDLFQKRAFASLGTLMPDGRPQVTPVRCDFCLLYKSRNFAQASSARIVLCIFSGEASISA